MAGEAGCRQRGQVMEPLGDTEVAGVVDRGLGAQCLPFLVVLLDLRVLVIDVQGRHRFGAYRRLPGFFLFGQARVARNFGGDDFSDVLDSVRQCGVLFA